MANGNNTSDVGFEQQIWQAAEILRGNMDASEYKHVVLGLIFLKYISDKFKERYLELVNEGDGFEEDRDEYTAKNVFYVPSSARWEKIAASARKEEIGTVIDDAQQSKVLLKKGTQKKHVHKKNQAESWESIIKSHCFTRIICIIGKSRYFSIMRKIDLRKENAIVASDDVQLDLVLR